MSLYRLTSSEYGAPEVEAAPRCKVAERFRAERRTRYVGIVDEGATGSLHLFLRMSAPSTTPQLRAVHHVTRLG